MKHILDKNLDEQIFKVFLATCFCVFWTPGQLYISADICSTLFAQLPISVDSAVYSVFC